jgi:hypothetical protein
MPKRARSSSDAPVLQRVTPSTGSGANQLGASGDEPNEAHSVGLHAGVRADVGEVDGDDDAPEVLTGAAGKVAALAQRQSEAAALGR